MSELRFNKLKQRTPKSQLITRQNHRSEAEIFTFKFLVTPITRVRVGLD